MKITIRFKCPAAKWAGSTGLSRLLAPLQVESVETRATGLYVTVTAVLYTEGDIAHSNEDEHSAAGKLKEAYEAEILYTRARCTDS